MGNERDNWLEGNLDQAIRFVQCCQLTNRHIRSEGVKVQYDAAMSRISRYVSSTTTFLENISPCRDCDGTGMRDTGGTQPWGDPIFIPCECQGDDNDHK